MGVDVDVVPGSIKSDVGRFGLFRVDSGVIAFGRPTDELVSGSILSRKLDFGNKRKSSSRALFQDELRENVDESPIPAKRIPTVSLFLSKIKRSIAF
jgi:hypothetical protein